MFVGTIRATSKCFGSIGDSHRGFLFRAMRSKTANSKGVIFITGTDTGVGKTLLTAMLLAHLRDRGVNALAMKPFCSGGTGDLEVLRKIQGHVISQEELNPYYFAEPVAPLVAAEKLGQKIKLKDVLNHISKVKKQCDVLLIEGSGGIMVPLGEGFLVVDLIRELNCPVLVVGRDRLGIINHSLLTCAALQTANPKRFKIVLMRAKNPDKSSETNAKTLGHLLKNTPVITLPFMAVGNTVEARVKNCFKKMKKTLAQILTFDSFCVRSLRVGSRRQTVGRKKAKNLLTV